MPILKPSISSFAAFLVILLLHAEMHELAHTLPGAVICGGFGQRDFNSWSLLEGCASLVPTALGPIFTFGVAYCAAWYIRTNPKASPTLALLVLASTTLFGRLFTALLGGGDELTVVRGSLPEAFMPHAQLITVLLLLAVSAWPAWVAYRALNKRIGLLAAWAIAPFVLLLVLVLGILNGLLQIPSLATPRVLGSPPVVHIYTVAVLALSPFAWRTLKRYDAQPLSRADPLRQRS